MVVIVNHLVCDSYRAVTDTLNRLKVGALPYFELMQRDLFNSMMYVPVICLHFSSSYMSQGLLDLRLFLPRYTIMMPSMLLRQGWLSRGSNHRLVNQGPQLPLVLWQMGKEKSQEVLPNIDLVSWLWVYNVFNSESTLWADWWFYIWKQIALLGFLVNRRFIV